LKEQALQIEQLKARLAKLLRQRFGSSSEKMKGAIDQLELIIGDLETDLAEATPSKPALAHGSAATSARRSRYLAA